MLFGFVLHQNFSLPVSMFQLRKCIFSNPITSGFPKKMYIKYRGEKWTRDQENRKIL